MARRQKRKSYVSPLGALVTSVMRNMADKNRNVHPEIWARWHNIVGPQMYKQAFPKSLKGTTLTVGVKNSSWLQELSFIKFQIVDRLNEEVGPNVVRDIRLVLEPNLGKNAHYAPNVKNTPKRTPKPNVENLNPAIKNATNNITNQELKQAIQRAASVMLAKDKE